MENAAHTLPFWGRHPNVLTETAVGPFRIIRSTLAGIGGRERERCLWGCLAPVHTANTAAGWELWFISARFSCPAQGLWKGKGAGRWWAVAYFWYQAGNTLIWGWPGSFCASLSVLAPPIYVFVCEDFRQCHACGIYEDAALRAVSAAAWYPTWPVASSGERRATCLQNFGALGSTVKILLRASRNACTFINLPSSKPICWPVQGRTGRQLNSTPLRVLSLLLIVAPRAGSGVIVFD